jgi:4-alpha-glucanotransferase
MLQNSSHQARCAGVLLHISSLPAGDFGADAQQFVDFLADFAAKYAAR